MTIDTGHDTDIHAPDSFAAIALPHLDAAYNLARWLTRDDHAAEDLVQVAYMRALRFFDGFHGGDARAWLLTIVRNTYYTNLRANRHERDSEPFDEDAHGAGDGAAWACPGNPEQILARSDTARTVNQALESLPPLFREVVILKELDELSYKQIAEIAGIPLGTVMSRLARGRKLLLEYLTQQGCGE